MTRKIKKSLKQDWETDMETTIRETTSPDVLGIYNLGFWDAFGNHHDPVADIVINLCGVGTKCLRNESWCIQQLHETFNLGNCSLLDHFRRWVNKTIALQW